MNNEDSVSRGALRSGRRANPLLVGSVCTWLVVLLPTMAFSQGGLFFSNFYNKDTANRLPGAYTPIYVGSVGSGVYCDENYYTTLYGGVNGIGASWSSAGSGMACFQTAVVGGTNELHTFHSGEGQGYLSGRGFVVLPGVLPMTTVGVQMRAWSKSLGPDWQVAWQSWTTGAGGYMGFSEDMTLMLGDPTSPVAVRLANNPDSDQRWCSSPGLSSFAVSLYRDAPATMDGNLVPEPSVLALAGLGLVGAFMVRRRK